MEIKLALTDLELESVYALRYSIYIEELNKTFIKHNHEQKILKDEFDDDAFHICLWDQGKLIGTVRLRYPQPGDSEINRLNVPIDFQEKYKISVTSRLMLKKEYRNSSAILKLMNFTFNKNIRDRVDFGIIEVEKHLVRMYKRFGFHELGSRVNEYNLERVLMFINARDLDHFKMINSPYQEVFTSMVNDMNNEFSRYYQNY
jgi:predicted GNAT family N-acyltransferase